MNWEDEVIHNECNRLKIDILDSVNFASATLQILYEDGESINETFTNTLTIPVKPKAVVGNLPPISFYNDGGGCADCVVLQVSYFKDNKMMGSSLINPSYPDNLKLLKYKIELPRGAKVTLFDGDAEVKYLAWNIPCPNSLPNMTFLQVKAANGFEQQLTPSAGSQTIELYMELGRRYAVFGEIWTYSFAQVLWFADLRVQLADNSWQNCIPTAGEGGTIVTALPQ